MNAMNKRKTVKVEETFKCLQCFLWLVPVVITIGRRQSHPYWRRRPRSKIKKKKKNHCMKTEQHFFVQKQNAERTNTKRKSDNKRIAIQRMKLGIELIRIRCFVGVGATSCKTNRRWKYTQSVCVLDFLFHFFFLRKSKINWC